MVGVVHGSSVKSFFRLLKPFQYSEDSVFESTGSTKDVTNIIGDCVDFSK